jgi:hypothetical protein
VVNWSQVSTYLKTIKVAGGVADLSDWAKTQWSKLEDFLKTLTD